MDDDLYKGLDENENDTLEMITKSPSLPLFEEDICFDITHVLTQLFFIDIGEQQNFHLSDRIIYNLTQVYSRWDYEITEVVFREKHIDALHLIFKLVEKNYQIMDPETQIQYIMLFIDSLNEMPYCLYTEIWCLILSNMICDYPLKQSFNPVLVFNNVFDLRKKSKNLNNVYKIYSRLLSFITGEELSQELLFKLSNEAYIWILLEKENFYIISVLLKSISMTKQQDIEIFEAESISYLAFHLLTNPNHFQNHHIFELFYAYDTRILSKLLLEQDNFMEQMLEDYDSWECNIKNLAGSLLCTLIMNYEGDKSDIMIDFIFKTMLTTAHGIVKKLEWFLGQNIGPDHIPFEEIVVLKNQILYDQEYEIDESDDSNKILDICERLLEMK